MNKIEITEEQGEELYELEWIKGASIEIEGHTYTYYSTEENVESHRWANTNLLVYKRNDGKLFGMLWDVGSTESQESGFIYNLPELYEVVAKEIKTVTYVAVKEG